MKISRKSIRDIKNYLHEIGKNEEYYVGAMVLDDEKNKLTKIGFSSELKKGETIVPHPSGKRSKVNVFGKYIVDKSLPKEERWFEREYHIVDWHGNDHYGSCYQKRMCYQRRYIEPNNYTMSLEEANDEKIVVSTKLVNDETDDRRAVEIVNLFLEIFGTCFILNEQKVQPNKNDVVRLNWTILPKGEYPWEKNSEFISKIISIIPQKQRGIVKERHKYIESFQPDFVAVGDYEFWGYVVYGFEKKNIFIMECCIVDNATYIFGEDWKELSRLSKAQIMAESLQKDRVIHSPNWRTQISAIIAQ